MNPMELKFRFVVGITCVVLFVAGIGWVALRDEKKNVEYPEIKKSEKIKDEIESVEIERSFGRVRFQNGLKRSIYFARNNAYDPADIIQFFQKGDQVIKLTGDDTVRVIRGKVSYIFVLGEDIHCCKE